MKQTHALNQSLVFAMLCVIILLAGCGSAPTLPLATDAIDLSNDNDQGYGFGNGDPNDAASNITLEQKRWQTFTATSYRAVTAVAVKIRKLPDLIYGTEKYTPVLVELYNTTADGKPADGQRLAYGLINPDWITESFTEVRTGLYYDGLVPGKQYAIVLTQGVLNGYHYEWCTKTGANSGLHFGKYQINEGGWHDETESGYGWLKVYVASRIPPPTRIFIYPATYKNTGNLKGLYADARTGADFIAAYRPLSLAGKTTHAFISISAADSIADMPAKFGFPDNIPIVMVADDTRIVADNWNDLLDGTLKMSLTEALGLTGNHGWWSGSNTNGTCDVSTTDCTNCNGWTDGSNNTYGMTGGTNYTDATWIHSGIGQASGLRYVLGIAY